MFLLQSLAEIPQAMLFRKDGFPNEDSGTTRKPYAANLAKAIGHPLFIHGDVSDIVCPHLKLCCQSPLLLAAFPGLCTEGRACWLLYNCAGKAAGNAGLLGNERKLRPMSKWPLVETKLWLHMRRITRKAAMLDAIDGCEQTVACNENNHNYGLFS